LEDYLVVKNPLTPEEVTKTNRIADRIYPEDYLEATEQHLRNLS
jgi:hypothetical protein